MLQKNTVNLLYFFNLLVYAEVKSMEGEMALNALNQLFPTNKGLNLYIWLVFSILPFYFIFHTKSIFMMVSGVILILLFFISNRISAISKGGFVYFWVGIQMAICIAMSLIFGFVYFSLFLAYYIGNVENKVGFFILYGIHVGGTVLTVNWGFFTQNPLFFSQFPFILICVIGVILLPLSSYNIHKRERLEAELKDAHKQISDLVKLQERQRIARDLHDILGQKLSLIGLKSDLAGKLIQINPDQAKNELKDIQVTARTALKEVREIVADMRGTKMEDELIRIKQILRAAQMEFYIEGEESIQKIPLLVENVLSMCLKEAITNIVKHSRADECRLDIKKTHTELTMIIQDNGTGIVEKEMGKGNGLKGMRERLEFVNGSLDIRVNSGTELIFKIPLIERNVQQEVMA
jgi:two-component system sensor histidine kinase DesK